MEQKPLSIFVLDPETTALRL